MKAIQLMSHGDPAAVCRCVQVPDACTPAVGQISVRIKAAAINPADLLIFEARYPGPEQFPAQVGIEGAGKVVALGAGVSGFETGDHVISMGQLAFSNPA